MVWYLNFPASKTLTSMQQISPVCDSSFSSMPKIILSLKNKLCYIETVYLPDKLI